MKYDVIIIGAGPGGIFAAYELMKKKPDCKIAVFEDDQELFKASIDHTAEELKPYTHVFDEFEYRKNLIVKTVEEAGYSISDFGCVAGRGGLCRPVEGGTYAVNDRMIEDFRNIEWNRKKIFL